MEKYQLTEADRDFIAKQQRASRQRRMQAFKASAVAVPIAIVCAGIPGAAVFWWLVDEKIAGVAAMPGLALAVYFFRRMHPDFSR